jgi:hypothetical protein
MEGWLQMNLLAEIPHWLSAWEPWMWTTLEWRQSARAEDRRGRRTAQVGNRSSTTLWAYSWKNEVVIVATKPDAVKAKMSEK